MTQIKITITDQLTYEVVTDCIIEVASNDYAIFEANHQCMAEAFPNCTVEFDQVGGDSYISSAPINERKDVSLVLSGKMTWDEYYIKWYGETPA